MGDERTPGAGEHCLFITYVATEVFQEQLSNVLAIIGDGYSTNRTLSWKSKKPFLGRYNRRYNVAVKTVLGNPQQFSEKIQRIMKKLPYTI